MIDNGNGITYVEIDSKGRIVGASKSPFTPQPGNSYETYNGTVYRGEDGELHKDVEKATPQRTEDFGYTPMINYGKRIVAVSKDEIVTASEDFWLIYRFANYYNGYFTTYPPYPSTSTTAIQRYDFLNQNSCSCAIYVSKNTRYKLTGNCSVDMYKVGDI